jgi:hypothetical protein
MELDISEPLELVVEEPEDETKAVAAVVMPPTLLEPPDHNPVHILVHAHTHTTCDQYAHME